MLGFFPCLFFFLPIFRSHLNNTTTPSSTPPLFLSEAASALAAESRLFALLMEVEVCSIGGLLIDTFLELQSCTAYFGGLGGLSHARRGPRGCADGLWPIQDSLLCDLSPWWLRLALMGKFWQQRSLDLFDLKTVDQSLSVISFEFPVRHLSGKFKLSFFSIIKLTTKPKTTGGL